MVRWRRGFSMPSWRTGCRRRSLREPLRPGCPFRRSHLWENQMFGKLTWDAIPFNQPIPLITSLVILLVIAALALWVWRKGWWPYLWNEYITSTDHKRIGVMYIVLALVMLVRGFADALMMRIQQSLAIGASQGYLPPEHYNQIFSAHGTIMIFFVAMPFVIGFMNFVVPLQLGVRDVAFPTMNNVSFWLTASGALLVNISLFVGEFARTGWLAFPPPSEKAFSPGVGVDYYLVALQISGAGTILTAVNFVTTILKIRAPGMSYLRMPVFCWTALASNLIMLAAFPVLTVALAELMLDRYLGFHFFTNDGGGNSMLYMNLIWVWGHPEVYILVLLAIPPVDFIVHNSLFLVAHFHNVIIPGVVFAILAGYTYWFPKAFGFTLDERLGKAVFWCWFIGFNLAFMPSYLLGFWGGTRRMQHISDPSWKPWLGIELIGSFIIALGVVFLAVQLFYSIKTRDKRRDLTGDPWDGRTLEWLTLSPPPHYNFAVLPDVHGEEAYWHRKQEAIERDELIPEPDYQPIEMPLNTPVGIICAFFASICGFALIWYIWWLAIVGLIGAFAIFVWYAWRDEHEHIIPVEEVIANARERRRIRMENLHQLSQST